MVAEPEIVIAKQLLPSRLESFWNLARFTYGRPDISQFRQTFSESDQIFVAGARIFQILSR